MEVRFQNDNVWLTQKLMAALYACSTDNISLHLRNIFRERELDEKAVTEESSATAADGKNYRTRFYSLEAIIAADYSPNTVAAERFFATVQNKLHFAITGQTAAEIIAHRADAKHPTMGLTNWRKGPAGKILQDKGRVSHAVAQALAEEAYQVFRVEQDRRYVSDFDRILKNLPAQNKGAEKLEPEGQ